MNKTITVFFSWQNDKNNNRYQYRNDIEKAIKLLNSTQNDYQFKYDEATRNTSGCPDISSTLFKKIKSCDIFIADVSKVLELKKNSTVVKHIPNPNVMIELGYALALKPDEKIILIHDNESEIALLPFDINHRRLTKLNPNKNNKKQTKKNNGNKNKKNNSNKKSQNEFDENEISSADNNENEINSIINNENEINSINNNENKINLIDTDNEYELKKYILMAASSNCKELLSTNERKTLIQLNSRLKKIIRTDDDNKIFNELCDKFASNDSLWKKWCNLHSTHNDTLLLSYVKGEPTVEYFYIQQNN